MSGRVELHRRLTVRILLFLAFALVPLGIIGMLQNQRLNTEIEQRSNLSLLALTEQAASGERRAIQRTFGATQVLAGTIDFLLRDPDTCSEALARRTQEAQNFAFIGYIERSGISRCSTAGAPVDFSDMGDFQSMLANPRSRLSVSASGRVSGENVLVFAQPHYKNDTLHGFIAVSLPISSVLAEPDFFIEAEPITLVTFNTEGDLLTSDRDERSLKDLLPAGMTLESLASGYARTFSTPSQGGKKLAYSVVPIVPGVAYALGLWSPNSTIGATITSPFVSMFLPFVMWFASLLVAWFVVDRFVVDRVKDLNRAMRRFADDRTLPDRNITNMSAELADLNASFRSMAENIVFDEAKQEKRLREKSILLKEVHHRVKNNLQIISSIMNMQIRKAKADETRRSLAQVQDRILGLSDVHRTLYQTENLTEVDAGQLIAELVNHSKSMVPPDRSIVFDLSLDEVIIFPDQAVPLTMLVSEALTNALKYIGGPSPKIAISLQLDEDRCAKIAIENSTGPESTFQPLEGHLSGLGRQLIRAFVSQLNGSLEVDEQPDSYRIDVAFLVETEQAGPRDF